MRQFESYAGYYDLIYKNRDYKSEAQMVYEWAGRPKLIVDLGCGTGRHHHYWPCKVVGVDNSLPMLANKKGVKTLNRYIKGDINKGEFPKGNRCYTALFNVIGYCNLESVIGHLDQKKGGVFIFDVWDNLMFERDGGFKHRIKHFKWGRVEIKNTAEMLEIRVKPNRGEQVVEYHKVIPYDFDHIWRIATSYGYKIALFTTPSWTTWYRLEKL